MSLKDIREQVRVILSNVDGVGVVHDYQRWAATWEKFLDLFKDSENKINGWTITRESTPEGADTFNKHTRTHRIKITGVYGLKDEEATELIFQDLVEAICAAFRVNPYLNNMAEESGPPQVDVVEPRMFGGVLCHYAEISLAVIERESWR